MERGAKIFVWCMVIFIAHQVMERLFHIHLLHLDNYLDPLVAMPIVLQLITWERRFILKDPNYTLPRLHLLSYFILMSAISELLFPAINNKFIADVRDVLCFGVGTIAFEKLKLI